ncbi:DegV family protein [uncultured Eubacterium sp.]|uniref:DegV family protein n=1 Tax=uncultured Eubacterium sp. TaxID=165185 RepID=UPI002609AA48|nr:DegV family protein [uncultured Eubacterium sp.]
MTNVKDIAITTDSTCDLPQRFIDENDITVVPLTVLLGDTVYRDGVDIKPDDVYSFVEKTGKLPKTSAVTPAEYFEVFKQLTDEGKKVVHIGFSSGLSSSFQNACVAASEFDNVFCVDSKTLCTAQGLLVLKACDYRAKGMDAKKIADRVTKLVPKVSATFVLDGLEYLHKGGRCSSVARFGANVLGIKPSIAVDNQTGKLEVSKKYRGKTEIVYKQYIADRMNEIKRIQPDRVVIAESGGVSSQIIAFAKGVIEGKDKFNQVIVADAGCTISSHCGPKTFAIFYIKK